MLIDGKPAEVLENPYRELTYLRAENERLKAELAEAKKDAERWKYARRKMCFTGNGDGTCMMHGINLPADIPGWPDPGKVEEFCDAAIDAAMKGKLWTTTTTKPFLSKHGKSNPSVSSSPQHWRRVRVRIRFCEVSHCIALLMAMTGRQ